MNLNSKIVKNGTVIGVYISDDEIEYCLVLEALKTKAMLDRLEEAGWKLVGLPCDFSKNGLHIEQLPAMDYEALSDDMRFDFYTFDGEILADSELVKRLPKNVESTKPWRSPILSIIKTREDLLAFLKAKAWRNFSPKRPETFLPLNSFVNPEALFSPDEYANRDNREITRLIEERRKLSYPAYCELVGFLTKMGLRRDFTCMEFQEQYFSWGICGINDVIISDNTDQSPTRLGQLRVGNDSGGFTVTKDVLMDCNGETIPPIQPGWVLRSNNVEYEGLQKNECVIVNIAQDTVDTIRSIVCRDMRVKYDNTVLHIYIDSAGVAIRGTVAQPYYPFSYRIMPYHLYNIYDPAVQNEMTDASFIEAMATELIEKLSVKSDASTLKALKAIGMTENCALGYIAARMAESTPMDEGDGGVDTEESGRMKVIQAGISSYLSGVDDQADFADSVHAGKLDSISSEHDYIPDIEDFVQDCRDGQTNLDQTQVGASLDEKNNRSMIMRILSLSMSCLNCSRESLLEQVRAINITDDVSSVNIFGSTGQYLKLPVIRGYLKIRGYEKDVDGYMMEAARTAMLWINVVTAYTESTHVGKHRHVGIQYQVFEHCNRTARGMTLKHQAVENYFTELAEAAIRNLPTQEKRSMAKMKIDAYVCRLIFSAYNAPGTTIRLPETLGGALCEVSPEMCSYIRSGRVTTVRYESLFGICDMMTMNGEFIFFCNNARLSPNLVIPYKGEHLQERPFLPNWIDTTRDLAHRQTWSQTNIIPDVNFTGIFRLYPSQHGIDHVDENQKMIAFSRGDSNYESRCYHESPYSLLNYYDTCINFRKQALESKTYQLSNIPTLEESAYPRSFGDITREPCEELAFQSNFQHSKPRLITKDEVSKDFPEIVESSTICYDDERTETRKVREFVSVNNLPADILAARGANFIHELCLSMSEKIPLHFHFGDLCIFKDGFKFMFSDVAKQDFSNYAVEYLDGYYYVLDASGGLFVRGLGTKEV